MPHRRKKPLNGLLYVCTPVMVFILGCTLLLAACAPAPPDFDLYANMRAYAEQIRPYVSRRYRVLGTDGYGRSDTREALRTFF